MEYEPFVDESGPAYCNENAVAMLVEVEDLFDAYLCTTYHGRGRERTVNFEGPRYGGVNDAQSSCGVCLVARPLFTLAAIIYKQLQA